MKLTFLILLLLFISIGVKAQLANHNIIGVLPNHAQQTAIYPLTIEINNWGAGGTEIKILGDTDTTVLWEVEFISQEGSWRLEQAYGFIPPYYNVSSANTVNPGYILPGKSVLTGSNISAGYTYSYNPAFYNDGGALMSATFRIISATGYSAENLPAAVSWNFGI